MKCVKKAEPKKDDEPQTRMTKATGSKPEASLSDILSSKDWMQEGQDVANKGRKYDGDGSNPAPRL